MIVETIHGKDIPLARVMEIRKIRAVIFGNGIFEELKIKMPFTDEVLFMVNDENKRILAVGCLFQIQAKLLKKSYKIQGIGSIASVEKGKGYGKMLMQEMRSYLEKNKLTGVGFCSPTNTTFYQKCDFLIQKNSIHRFINTSGTGRQPDADEDILYLEGKNKFMKTFLSHPKAKVYIPRFW